MLMIIGVLLLAAAGAGMMLLGRKGSSDAAPVPAPTARPAAHTPAASAQSSGSTTPAVRPLTRSPRRTASTAPSDGLPTAIQQALAANRVVVIALYDPRAKVDDTALKEAQAGAQLAGTNFVPVDVTQDDVAPLNLRYGAIQDPAVLVLRPPGDLVVRIDGFADRDTVAQAAANAAQ